MSGREFLAKLAALLNAAQIPHMLTGSFASSVHGTPRSTQDVDVVIDANAQQIRDLIALLPSTNYYVNLQTALQAQRDAGQFNILELESGWKADLIFVKRRPFSLTEFERRQEIEVQGVRIPTATPEDVAIAKLEWAKLGESQRQIEDVAGLLRTRWSEMDRTYVRKWVLDLQLGEQWSAACRLAGIDAVN